MQKLLSLVLAPLFMLISAGPATPAFLGDTLKPFVSLSEIYDSNIFRVRDSSQLQSLIGDKRLADFITTVTVGSEVHYAISREKLNLLLRRDFVFYSHYTSQNLDQNEVSGDLGITLFDKLNMKFDGYYRTAPESRIDYRSAALNERTNTAFGVSLGYETAAGLGFTAAYRNTGVDYSLLQYRQNEYGVDSYSGTMSYRFSADSRVYGTYQRDDTNYRENMLLGAASVNNSSTADSIRFGLEKTLSPKTSISCYVGYLNRRHDYASVRDFSGVIGRAAVTYGVTDKLGLVMNGERQIYEETYADRIYSITNMFGIGLAYDITAKIKATFYDKLSWKNFRDIPLSGVAKRNDFLHELNLGAEWTPINRLTLNLGYQYSTRSSNDNTLNFSDHMAVTRIDYKF